MRMMNITASRIYSTLLFVLWSGFLAKLAYKHWTCDSNQKTEVQPSLIHNLKVLQCLHVLGIIVSTISTRRFSIISVITGHLGTYFHLVIALVFLQPQCEYNVFLWVSYAWGAWQLISLMGLICSDQTVRQLFLNYMAVGLPWQTYAGVKVVHDYYNRHQPVVKKQQVWIWVFEVGFVVFSAYRYIKLWKSRTHFYDIKNRSQAQANKQRTQ